MGVNLGADHCAEHEWGIKGLRSAFGLPGDDVFGIERRTITTLPKYLYQLKVDGDPAIVCAHWPESSEEVGASPHVRGELTPRHGAKFGSAWDEASFGVRVPKGNPVPGIGFDYLEALWEAFVKKDVAIWLGGGGVFKNSGLMLTIVSRMPGSLTTRMMEVDTDGAALRKEAEKTQIAEKLKAAGKRWFALSPRWKDSSKKEVVFWLNPEGQHLNNYGEFTVADLELWIKDQGPIPMTKKQSGAARRKGL
jgi:hypothetical protein